MSDRAVIHSMLCQAPERWGPVDRDDLTAAEEQALEELSRRGLIELRQNGCITLVDDPRPFAFRVQYAGNGGRREAVYALLKALTDLGHDGTAFTLAMAGDEHWRRSAEGESLSDDLARTTPDELAAVMALTLPPASNPFSGAGTGKALRFDRSTEAPMLPQEPVPVAITNVEEFTAALAAPRKAGTPPGRAPVVREAVDQYLETHHALHCRQDSKPTMDDWARVIAEELARFKDVETTPLSVRQILKKRWAFLDAELIDGSWTARPQRVG